MNFKVWRKKSKKVQKRGIFLIILFLFLFVLSFCSSMLKKNLDPESREFLSKVRYIITKQEEKIFLHLPPSEREDFILEFWEKRDPDPDTEENEFKEQYFQRIEEANRLFKDGTTPGWLQDRGRVYILLGPPDNRVTYPRGPTFRSKPLEIWYYGFFPVVFIDHYWNGNYKLVSLSPYNIAQINKAQLERKPQIEDKEVVFDFEIKKKQTKQGKSVLEIRIPYPNIWFEETKNKLEATVELWLKILDSSENEVWNHHDIYPISLESESFEEYYRRSYVITIPIGLKSGKYTVIAELENKIDGSRVVKKKKINLSDQMVYLLKNGF